MFIVPLSKIIEKLKNKEVIPDNWEQMKESSKYGEIALHSYSHKQLMKLSNEEIWL